MNTPTTENGNTPPRKKKTSFWSLLTLFVLFGLPFIFCFLIMYPGALRNSREMGGVTFFHDLESSLREKYNGTVMIRNKCLGSDFCFRVDIVTAGEDAPSPVEIAEEIYRQKKQSEFMSEEVLIVMIDRDREDHGVHFAFPGKKGYEGTRRPLIYLPYFIGGRRDF